MNIIGHHNIQSFFETATKKGTLSHAYCFVGPEAVGKKLLAQSLASKLLGTEKLKNHPDVLFIEQEINLKTGKTKKYIDVDQIHKVTAFFALFSAMNGYRIAIIDGAEKMNEHAGNALLKTLEELPDKAIIFLITSNKDALLPTILSRCQVVFFERLTVTDMTVMAQALSINDQEMIRYAAGQPGTLVRWQADPDSYEEHKTAIDLYVSLYGKALYKKIESVELLFTDKKDHIATREKLVKTLDIWITITRDIYQTGQGNNVLLGYKNLLALTLSKENMVELVTKMAMAKRKLRQNIHPRLLIEDILISIP